MEKEGGNRRGNWMVMNGSHRHGSKRRPVVECDANPMSTYMTRKSAGGRRWTKRKLDH